VGADVGEHVSWLQLPFGAPEVQHVSVTDPVQPGIQRRRLLYAQPAPVHPHSLNVYDAHVVDGDFVGEVVGGAVTITGHVLHVAELHVQ